MTTNAQGPASAVPTDPMPNRITIMLEEYRQLYPLVLFRLAALERRLPLMGLTLLGLVLSQSFALASVQWIVLVGIPPWLVWLAQTTVNHARSLEDALRRIEDIERTVDDLVSGTPLRFQSSHPSRGVHVGGRTGDLTVIGVIAMSIVVLVACAYIVIVTPQESPLVVPLYLLYAGAAFVMIINGHRSLVLGQSPLPEKLPSSPHHP